MAVGSGQILGKGVGFGTQSRLKFLPEYQTDFIFAAFAEEWGFIGILIIFLLFGTILWRIVEMSMVGATNFETLFGLGLAIMFLTNLKDSDYTKKAQESGEFEYLVKSDLRIDDIVEKVKNKLKVS